MVVKIRKSYTNHVVNSYNSTLDEFEEKLIHKSIKNTNPTSNENMEILCDSNIQVDFNNNNYRWKSVNCKKCLKYLNLKKEFDIYEQSKGGIDNG